MLKNIFRLPGTFAPMFLAVFMAVVLILLGSSVCASCDRAKEAVNDSYGVSLTLTLKERFRRVPDSDGKYVLENANESLIDARILDIIESNGGTGSVEYITGKFFFAMELMCPKNAFDAMEAAIASGGSFIGTAEKYVTERRTIYDIGVIGCTDAEYVPQALGVNEAELEISYSDGCSFDDGIIIPEYLYELYGHPESIVIGWYVTQTTGKISEDGNGRFVIDENLADRLGELRGMPPAPKETVKVAGYYRCPKDGLNLMVCTPGLWSRIYSAQDYYRSEKNTQNYYRSGVSAINECGLTVVNAALSAPDRTADVIRELVAAGIDADDYLITADDFDYKFAVSQIEGVKGLADTVYAAACGFGAIMTVIMICYSIKKRRGEIYTLLTLGKSKSAAVAGVCAEISAVLLAAVLAGLLAGLLTGNAVCGYINGRMRDEAMATVTNLSRLSDLMVNSEQLRAQLAGAADEYLRSGSEISYGAPSSVYLLFSVFWLCASLSAWIYTNASVSKNLMQRR